MKKNDYHNPKQEGRWHRFALIILIPSAIGVIICLIKIILK